MAHDELAALRNRLRSFSEERDWDQFHTPKNLAMALAGEAGELVAEFQWLTPEEAMDLNPEQRARVEAEAADVLLYLVRLADKLDFDLFAAATKKIELNQQKYPARQVRGSARKYTEY